MKKTALSGLAQQRVRLSKYSDRSDDPLRSAISIALFLVSSACVFIIASAVEMGSPARVVVCDLVFSAAAMLVLGTSPPSLRLALFACWRGALVVGSLVLYWGWVPSLKLLLDSFDYDPIVYYSGATAVASGVNAALAGINYPGVYYYYGLLFYLFGESPLVAFVGNSFLLLAGIAAVVRAYGLSGVVSGRLVWLIGGIQLIPELIWFNALTSKDGPVGSAILLAVASGASLLGIATGRVPRFPVRPLMGFVAATVLIALLRTSALIAVVPAVVAPFCVSRSIWSPRRLAMGVALAVSVGAIGYISYREVGAYGFSVGLAGRYSDELMDRVIVSSRSFSALIYAERWWHAPLLLPIRMTIFVVAPLPRVPFTVAGLFASEWNEWQGLCAFASLFAYIPALFAFVAGGVECWMRRQRTLTALWLSGLAQYATIMLGVNFVHERYRVMAVPLLCIASVATACSASASSRRVATVIVSIILGGATILFVVYKSVR